MLARVWVFEAYIRFCYDDLLSSLLAAVIITAFFSLLLACLPALSNSMYFQNMAKPMIFPIYANNFSLAPYQFQTHTEHWKHQTRSRRLYINKTTVNDGIACTIILCSYTKHVLFRRICAIYHVSGAHSLSLLYIFFLCFRCCCCCCRCSTHFLYAFKLYLCTIFLFFSSDFLWMDSHAHRHIHRSALTHKYKHVEWYQTSNQIKKMSNTKCLKKNK